MTHKAEPAIIAIFGATGDLAHRMLLPALFEIEQAGELPEGTIVLGIDRRPGMDDASFRKDVHDAIYDHESDTATNIAAWCAKNLFYFGIGESTPQDFEGLRKRIESLEGEHTLPGNRLFYLAVPPVAFGPTIESLGLSGLNNSPGWTRFVIEKPFGRDLESARGLNALIHRHFAEDQVYRIDHFLGKETVQNLLAFRFGNTLFESVWNRDKVEKVEIVVAEELGVEDRASYYEKAGALRDMVQNHLTQLLALTAMEVPSAFQANDIRYEKVKVLRAIAPIEEEDVLMGQYTHGVIGSEGVPGYKEEHGVAPDSKTETFVELKLSVETWRWHGVPFYLRTGKRLKERISEIIVTFKCPPVSIFKPYDMCEIAPNVLVIKLQPNEGFRVSFQVKKPGAEITLKTEWMNFSYAEVFGPLPEAYHTLLLDVLRGDQTLFVSADETLASWELYTPVLERQHMMHPYPAGSWGPKSTS
ncbi:MAG: glucose-6-phosphate dehydrogenase [Bacteroidota bacterium]|nr:glucose-6-phosphate dehydrogenase [Bacteroidota bacterium]MDP4232220.1 glucose-6-phosphate dehydrogenase [Bacteroidota bacterium]MDP4243599.1 glucose-6-phosphate dehydrogenase [Bacteroidota bacterium]MDP4288749.1 glucose-6-phosphate dehydrogenase [Bacteroidota bacterium]